MQQLNAAFLKITRSQSFLFIPILLSISLIFWNSRLSAYYALSETAVSICDIVAFEGSIAYAIEDAK